MKRTQEDADKTRQMILEAGIRVFAEKGYYHTSMEDIARAAHVTRGAMYWHYKNKADFIIAMADSIYTDTSERIVCYFNQGNSMEERIAHTIKNIGYWYLEDDQICMKRNAIHSVMIGKCHSFIDKVFHAIFKEESFPSDTELTSFIIKKIQELLHIHILKEGHEKDIQEGFLMLLSFVEGFISIIIRTRNIMTRQVIDNIVDKFMEGLSHSFKHILEEK